jgi:hypothetical protein
MIEFFSPEDLSHIVAALAARDAQMAPVAEDAILPPAGDMPVHPNTTPLPPMPAPTPEEDLYSIKNFSV